MRAAVRKTGRPILGALAVAIPALLAAVGPAAAQTPTPPEPPPPDYYLIIDGPGVGYLLLTDAGSLIVPPTYIGNSVNGLDGHVGGTAGDHCNGALHYHGLLLHQEDPDPGACGWGKVKRVAQNGPGHYIGAALQNERRVLTSLDGGNAVRNTDVGDLQSASGALLFVDSDIDNAVRSGQIIQEDADRLKTLTKVAQRSDDLAAGAGNRILNNGAQPKDLEAMKRALRVGIDDKKNVLRALQKYQLLN